MPPPPKRRVATSSTANNDKRKQATVSKAPPGAATGEGAKRSATNVKAIGKQKHFSQSAEEQRSAAMRSVNAAIQTLASIVNSHGKATSYSATGKKTSTSDCVKAAKTTALKALRELRKISPGNFDVERAASSVITRLVAIGEVRTSRSETAHADGINSMTLLLMS
jgi:separase